MDVVDDSAAAAAAADAPASTTEETTAAAAADVAPMATDDAVPATDADTAATAAATTDAATAKSAATTTASVAAIAAAVPAKPLTHAEQNVARMKRLQDTFALTRLSEPLRANMQVFFGLTKEFFEDRKFFYFGKSGNRVVCVNSTLGKLLTSARNANKIKVVNTGLRMLEVLKMKTNYPFNYRVVQLSVQWMYPLATRQIVRCTVKDVLPLFTKEHFELDSSAVSPNLRALLQNNDNLQDGAIIFLIKDAPKFNKPLCFCGFLTCKTIAVMLSKQDRPLYLKLLSSSSDDAAAASAAAVTTSSSAEKKQETGGGAAAAAAAATTTASSATIADAAAAPAAASESPVAKKQKTDK
jgi:hypothetical protein